MDEMYLKMILALTDEFFDGWEWTEGDKFISYIWKHGEEVPNPIINTIGNSCIVDEKIGSWLFGEFVEYSCKTRPVPSQEQLQKRLESKMLTTGGNRWHVFCTFDEFVRSEYERRSFWKTGTLITDSFEMLWLACVMKVKYGKEWDGEKWI